MDPVTKQTIEDFVEFITEKVHETKHIKEKFQIGTWSLQDYKVTVHVLTQNNGTQKIYFDEREILENKGNFTHLLDSAIDQLEALRE